MPSENNSFHKVTRHITVAALIYLAIFAVFFVITDNIFGNSNFLKSSEVIGTAVIPCEKTYQQLNIIEEKAVWLEVKKETTELCLPINDLAGLNNSFKLAESISLLAVFVAIVGVMLPLLSIITIKQQRVSIENRLETNLDHKFQQLQEKFEAESTNLTNSFKEKHSLLETEINAKAEDLISRFPKRLIEVNKLRLIYLDHLLRKITYTNDISDNTKKLDQAVARSIQMESALLMICIGSIDKVYEGFDIIRNFIGPRDILNNEPYITTLKQTLKFFYQAKVFNSDEKRKILTDFLSDKLETDPEYWINE